MDSDRHSQLTEENENDLQEAIRQNHRGWIETLKERRSSLLKIRPGGPDWYAEDKPAKTFKQP